MHGLLRRRVGGTDPGPRLLAAHVPVGPTYTRFLRKPTSSGRSAARSTPAPPVPDGLSYAS